MNKLLIESLYPEYGIYTQSKYDNSSASSGYFFMKQFFEGPGIHLLPLIGPISDLYTQNLTRRLTNTEYFLEGARGVGRVF